ncbi:MAG: Rpn family recombination-promoting nuclease/putative transposase, partial [Methyloprofundus sp.]|nr:Rpn family recombination-promoting nuclease/putative transposase [Methyloprofundus sp.]
IIEMQVLNHQGFEKRVLYNAAKNYSVQLNQSDDYHLLNPVIALNIVDFNMFEDSDKVISHFKLIEKEDFIHYSDDIELIFIELPKFNKTLDELHSLQDKWIYFIQNAGQLQFIPEQIDQNIKRALDIANEANLSVEELELQHKRKEFIFIQKSSIELARERGMEQGLEAGIEQGIERGIEQGLEQGIENTLKKIVMNAYRSGVPLQSISDITGLSEKDINSIIGK